MIFLGSMFQEWNSLLYRLRKSWQSLSRMWHSREVMCSCSGAGCETVIVCTGWERRNYHIINVVIPFLCSFVKVRERYMEHVELIDVESLYSAQVFYTWGRRSSNLESINDWMESLMKGTKDLWESTFGVLDEHWYTELCMMKFNVGSTVPEHGLMWKCNSPRYIYAWECLVRFSE